LTRTLGSARGAAGNDGPYRDHAYRAFHDAAADHGALCRVLQVGRRTADITWRRRGGPLGGGGGPLSLGWERARVGDASLHPSLELALGLDPLGIDPDPSLHLAPAHREGMRVRL
jgi:hypothetical protein